MTDYVHLIGAEQVQSAGRNMSGAAETMNQAALNICGAVERLAQLVERFEIAAAAISNPPLRGQ